MLVSSIGQLSWPSALLALLVLTLLYSAAHAFVNYRRLRQFKGPFLAGLSGHWLFWQSVNARVNKALYNSIQEYGTVARVGPNLVTVGDADVIRHIAAPGSAWRRAGWYEAMRLDPRHDSVFSTRDEKLHAELKAKEAGGYNGRDNDSLEPSLDSRIAELVQLIKTEYHGKLMDVASLMRFFTLDVLSTVAFGRPFGFMAANRDLWEYSKTTSDYMKILELNLNHPSLRWLFSTDLMQWLFAPRMTDRTGVGPMLKFAREAVAERYGPDAKVKKDMLGHFVTKGLDQLQCEVEAALQIMAGSDSTTTILRTAIFLLAGNPSAYAKLREEVDHAAVSSSSSSSIVRYSDARELPFLTACIWETFRLYPPLFGLTAKTAPPAGDTVKGIFFPGGLEVAWCPDAMCRRRDLFGEDADVYRPERWLDIDAGTHRAYYQAVDTIFGAGRFLCLGKHIAMMELYKTMFEASLFVRCRHGLDGANVKGQLIKQFDWVLANPMKGIRSHAYGIHVQSDMNMFAYVRK